MSKNSILKRKLIKSKRKILISLSICFLIFELLLLNRHTPTPTPTPSPSPTPTPTVTSTPSPTLTPTPTISPTSTPTLTPTPMPVSQFEQYFDEYSGQYKVDKNILKKIAYCESHMNPGAANGPYGGMYQFTISTWQSTRRTMGADENPDLRFGAKESIETAAFKISSNGMGAWANCSR